MRTKGAKTGTHGLGKIEKIKFEKLCAMMCTKEEIYNFFGVSHDTLERWCKDTYGEDISDVMKQYQANGKVSLRRIQFKLAEKNPTMAIFLGKNYLGQKDVIEETTIERIEIVDDMPKDDENGC